VSELHGFFAERASRAEEWTGSDPLTETACGS
jgi:hypothetical protein